MNPKNLLIGLASMLPFVCGTALAQFSCKVTQNSYPTANNGQSPAVATLPSFNVPTFDPNVPDGTVLFSRQLQTTANGLAAVSCSGSVENETAGRLESVGQYSTWPTGVAGIGVRMRFAMGSSSWWPTVYPTATTAISWFPYAIVFEVVKTGRITAGGKMSGEVAGVWLKNGTFQHLSFRINGSIELKPTVPTCSVTTKSIKVQFGEVNLNGTATAPEQPVNIGLQCSGGTSDAKTRMYLTLTDATNPGNRSDVLTLTNASTAKGVGIRIMNGTTPVQYGPDSSETGNPNQWFATEAGNQTVNIPLSARYVRTSDTLKAGTADAVATFTMSYQ